MRHSPRWFPTSHHILAQANTLHNAGRLAEAMTRHILTIEPNHPDALNLMGSIALRNGQAEAAIDVLTRAASLAPRATEPRINLGHALKALGRPAEAIVSYHEAVRLKPRDAQARYALGNGLLAAGNNEAAEAELREATRIAPRFAGAHNNLGHVLRQLGRPKDAESAFRRAISLAPGQAEWHLNLALAVGEQQRTEDAISALKVALLLAPDHVVALHASGTMLVRNGRYEDAIGPLRRLRALQPGTPDPFAGLAQALTALGEFDEALALAWETLLLVPDSAGARSNLSSALLALGRHTEAEAEFETALRLDPTHPFARTGRAFVRLKEGRLEDGWDDYEARLDAQRMGSDRKLTDLIDPASLMGEAWQGNPDYLLDKLRSISPGHLRALDGARDAAFVSLQLPRPEMPPPLPMIDLTAELTDFADTAALMEALDLIITVDTSVAHLAGALGRPVWLLNRFNTDWRWLMDRDDSPWYPTMRIFRQTAPPHWDDVLMAVRAALDCSPAAVPGTA